MDPSQVETRRLLLPSLATLGLFAAHHAYGAFVYHTHWRLHGAVVAAVVGAILYALHRRSHTRAAAIALPVVVVVVPVVFVGVFEGLYNHVLKDVLYLAGAPRDLLLHLFPPPAYELPNDALFEISGVAQAIAAAFAARALLRLRKGRTAP